MMMRGNKREQHGVESWRREREEGREGKKGERVG